MTIRPRTPRSIARVSEHLAAATLREIARKKRKLVARDVVTHVIEADTRERD